MNNHKKKIHKNNENIEKIIAQADKTILSKNPIVKWFSRKKFDIALKFAKLKKQDIILDFGCGTGWIKKNNPQFNITGYDITSEQSEIKDYTKLKPTKIFAMDVFEHIPKEELQMIIKNFKKMNSNFDLIVAIPTENWLSRKARKFLGKPERVKDHVTPLKDVLKILKSNFKLIKKMNFLTVSYIAKFNYHKP